MRRECYLRIRNQAVVDGLIIGIVVALVMAFLSFFYRCNTFGPLPCKTL